MNRFLSRRFLVALIVVLVAYALFSAGYYQEGTENYLFPSIIGVFILILSLTSLFRETYGLCVDDFKAFPLLRLLPALIIMFLSVFVVELLGMYFTAAVLLFLMSITYSPVGSVSKRVRNSVIFSLGFTAFMYVLFNLVLSVQTPRGIFI